MKRNSPRWSTGQKHGLTKSTAGLEAGIVSTSVSPPALVRDTAICGSVFWRLVEPASPQSVPVSTLPVPPVNGKVSQFGAPLKARIDPSALDDCAVSMETPPPTLRAIVVWIRLTLAPALPDDRIAPPDVAVLPANVELITSSWGAMPAVPSFQTPPPTSAPCCRRPG